MKDNKSAYNSNIYDEHITNVLPYYKEYHNQALDVVRAMGICSPVWLDTGCGTGTLAMRILETYPEAKLALCDPSEKMHIERRGVEVFPITNAQHLELLKKCGFRSVNVLWTSYLQAGFWAIK